MADRLRAPASFLTQSNALLRKNLTFQKRNMCSNVSLVLIPCLLCLILLGLQIATDKMKMEESKRNLNKCDNSSRGFDEGSPCPYPKPREWPPVLHVPDATSRAVTSDSVIPFTDLPDESCRANGSCPLTILVTGNNQSFGQILAGNLLSNDFPLNSSDVMDFLANNVMGSHSLPRAPNFLDRAFFTQTIYKVQRQCSPNSTFSIPTLHVSSRLNHGRGGPPHAVVRLASASPHMLITTKKLPISKSPPRFRPAPDPPEPYQPTPNPPPVPFQPTLNPPQVRVQPIPNPPPARYPPPPSAPKRPPPPPRPRNPPPPQAPNPGLTPKAQPNKEYEQEVRCVEALTLWRNNSSDINNELYKGYPKGNPERKVNEILAAYDFLNSNENSFNAILWYNSSLRRSVGSDLQRIGRSVNLASNAYLQFLQGPGTKMLFEFVKEMPKPVTNVVSIPDLSSLIGPLFFTWIILLLFPVVLKSLVYEKQQKLRIMMKMHGLGDGPYWMISYAYFLAVSLIYTLLFMAVGSIIGLKFFTINDYSIQFVFYFIYMNLQIAAAFLVASMFSNVKACTAIGYILVFGTGLLAENLFRSFIEDASVSRRGIILLQLYPGFSLYRGLYELAQYPLQEKKVGMGWGDLNDNQNGMREVFIIMVIEWFVVLFVAYCIDQVVSSGSGKSPLFFLQRIRKKKLASLRRPSLQRQGSKVSIQMEKSDVSHEIEMVERLVLEQNTSHAIVCDNLKKVYPGRDGNPEKFAVKGLSLALPPGECFGMLGPNGAGKTSFISMMTGLTKPTSGTAYVHGMDIRTQMNNIYTSMGFCPQHDLLWETLTGREHLLFYGRLKNLKGRALMQAVEESLKSVKLFDGGIADKQAGKYSGGMKRRLSVAISLIGDPKVVYMDEPSTGLDPSSRNHLWNVIKTAKQDRAIFLTTHSMEEAEVLCDRLGIFVDGRMQCIGNPKELKGRHGGLYVFTMTTSWEHEEEVERIVQKLSPNANRTYRLSGTQKFDLPKNEVRIADVFQAVEFAKSRFPVSAWGVVDTTLEDVFIKVAAAAAASSSYDI
ncbi:unnamed protein product [Prunus brigantina]